MAEDIAKAERPISLSEFGQHRSGALRHRYKVITLTPSARAISLCNLPRVAHSFACASLLAISTLECLFLLIIVVSLRPYVATLQVAFDLLMLT